MADAPLLGSRNVHTETIGADPFERRRRTGLLLCGCSDGVGAIDGVLAKRNRRNETVLVKRARGFCRGGKSVEREVVIASSPVVIDFHECLPATQSISQFCVRPGSQAPRIGCLDGMERWKAPEPLSLDMP